MSIVYASPALKAQALWPVDRVKDHVSKIGSGVTPSGGSAGYLDAGVPLLRSQNVHFDGLRLDDVAYIADETHKEMRGSRLQARDVLLNITGASIGRCAFVPDDFGEGNVNQHVCIVRTTPRLDHKFLTYSLCAPWGQDQIFASFTGASRQGLGQRDLGAIQIPLPPLSEQQRIAGYLDASCALIDAAVAAKRRQLLTLDALRSTLISRAVTHGLNSKVAMKSSGLDWAPDVPVHWRVQQIKRLCSLVRGLFTHRPRNDPALYDGAYPFIQTGDITAAGKYIRTHSQTLNELGLSASKQFPRGTLVMSIAANIGDVAILDFEACFPDSMIGMIPRPKTNLDFLYYLMRAMHVIMLRSAVQSTQLNLNYVRIGTNFAPVPPPKEQAAIAEYLDSKEHEFHLLSSTIETQIATLTSYRKSLIHECVTGQRRITEADINRIKVNG